MSHDGRAERSKSTPSTTYIKTLISVMRGLLSCLNHILNTPSLNAIPLVMKFQNMNFRGQCHIKAIVVVNFCRILSLWMMEATKRNFTEHAIRKRSHLSRSCELSLAYPWIYLYCSSPLALLLSLDNLFQWGFCSQHFSKASSHSPSFSLHFSPLLSSIWQN